MKILLIDVNCKNSSTGNIVYDLYTAIRAGGNEAAVCYGRGELVCEPDIYKFSPQWEIYTHAALTRLTGRTGCFSPVATRNLLRYMDSYNPDIVHIHELHAYFVNIAPVISYLKEKRIKTVWTFHCEFMYTGKCGHAYDCDKWQNECGNCPAVGDYPSSLLFDCTKAMFRKKKRLFENFELLTIITPSQWLADRVKKSFLSNKQITVIPNGIDTGVFYPRNSGSLRNKYGTAKSVIHVTADITSENKGGSYVLELAGRMPDVSFYIIGNSKPVTGLPDNVRALGTIENRQELARWYSFADVTLITSKKETFSLICAESLCCGTPIAGFEAGAPTEVAPEGYGMFVPYPDIDGLEKAARFALSGKLHTGEECAAFGKARYSKEVMGLNYIQLYEEVAAQ